MYKIVINICDVNKPTVFTSKEDKGDLINKINEFLSSRSPLMLDNGDVFFCDKNNIRSILITKADQNDN